MSRSRNIKPGFFRNADLVELRFEARLLFIGLWTIADRLGRLEDRPKQIKMELFPADNLNCDELLNDLAVTGMLVRYEVEGKRYLQITNFCKHQNPHRDEKESIIPAPCLHDASTVQAPCKDDASTMGILLIPDSLNLIPSLLIPEVAATAAVASKPAKVAAQPACPTDELINLYHELMPLNPRVKVPNAARIKAIGARWKEAARLSCKPFGYSNREEGLSAWRQFFSVCAESEFLTGRAQAAPGKPPFVADIDFLFSPSGFAKCLENKYHREAA